MPLPHFLRGKKEDKEGEKNSGDSELIDIDELKKKVGVLEDESDKGAGSSEESDVIYIKSIDLQSLSNIQQVLDELEKGNIVIVYVGRMQYGQNRELKRVVDQLRGACRSIGGDIAQLGQDYIVVTPSFVRISKKSSTQ
ncbi:MAG: cell division protein SepF [Candidatus Atabeyarchaeum deiterrae]